MFRNLFGNAAQRQGLPPNTPVLAIVTALSLVGFAVVVIVTGYGTSRNGALLIGLVLTTVPSVIAAAFAERVSRDVRNGVVETKAQRGAEAALAETGVTDDVQKLTEAVPDVVELAKRVRANSERIDKLSTQVRLNTAAHVNHDNREDQV